jgi:hypothetical protein
MAGNDKQLVATDVRYFSQGDETLFFEWLGRIKCIQNVRGDGRSLFIELGNPPTDEDLRELIGLFYRYNIDMRQLAEYRPGTRTGFGMAAYLPEIASVRSPPYGDIPIGFRFRLANWLKRVASGHWSR